MVHTSIATAMAAFAVATNAFLIPSTMSVPATMNLDTLLAPQGIKAEITCFDCYDSRAKYRPDNTTLAFSFSTGEHNTALLANGIPIYRSPTSLTSAEMTAMHSFAYDIAALAAYGDDSVMSVAGTDEVSISYDIPTISAATADDTGSDLITLDFMVTALDSTPVENAQSLKIRFIRDSQAKLQIVDVLHVEPDTKDIVEQDATIVLSDPPCTTIACRIHAFLSSFTSSSITTTRPRIGCGGRRRPVNPEVEAEPVDKEAPAPAQPGLPKIPHLRGGPPKFWTPIAGGRPAWTRPSADLWAKPVTVDVNDGEDVHILPFEHDDKEHHGPPSWFPHGERPSFGAGWFPHPGPEHHDEAKGGELPPHFPHHGHGHGPHGSWHHGEHGFEGPPPPPMSRIRCALAKFADMVLLPMVIGIAAGCTISGVGFVIGMGVVALYRIVFPRKTKTGDVEDAAEEKKGLMGEEEEVEEEESLPVYVEKE